MGRKMTAVALALCAALCGCEGNGIERDYHDETADGRFVGESSFYEYETVTDTETGVVYLVWNSGSGNASKGGITPLLGSDGSPTIDPRYAGE